MWAAGAGPTAPPVSGSRPSSARAARCRPGASPEQARPRYDEAAARGDLPRVVVAGAGTPAQGGFSVVGPEAVRRTAGAVAFTGRVLREAAAQPSR